jgi:hypothetical protein
MAKAGRKSEAKALEGKLLKAWHSESERDNSIKARAKRGIELGSIRAVERIIALVESQDERVAFAAAREILQRNFGMPKQSMDLAVTDTSAAHHAALKSIYEKAVARLAAKENAPPIDHNAQVVTPMDMQLESDIATGQTLAIDAGLEQSEPET